MSGKARIGSTVIGSSRSKSDRRVLQVRLGRPSTSALHEPHFAALQFQRTARSGASWPWIQCRASRTTIPSSTGTSNSSNGRGVAGAAAEDLQVRLRSSIASVVSVRRRAGCASSGGHRRQRRRSSTSIAPSPARATTLLRRPQCSSSVSGMVDPAVGAAALGPLPGAAGDRLGDDQQVPQLEDEVPARVVGPPPLTAMFAQRARSVGEPVERLVEVGLDPEDADEPLHRVLQLALERVRVLAVGPLERRRRARAPRRRSASGRDTGASASSAASRPPPRAGPGAEHEQVRQRVAAQPVRAVHAAGDLARRVQARHAWSRPSPHRRGCRPSRSGWSVRPPSGRS